MLLPLQPPHPTHSHPLSHLQYDCVSTGRELDVVAVIYTEEGPQEADAGSHPATQPPRWQLDVLAS